MLAMQNMYCQEWQRHVASHPNYGNNKQIYGLCLDEPPLNTPYTEVRSTFRVFKKVTKQEALECRHMWENKFIF